MKNTPTILNPLFTILSRAAAHLTYLRLYTISDEDKMMYSLYHLRNAAALLSPLKYLKYVQLSVEVFPSPVVPNILGVSYSNFKTEVSTQPEDMVRTWAEEIVSLEYLELNITYQEWSHSWWRIQSVDRTYRRVSEEEGLSAKNWFDLEDWK
ncbi:hypothetical protein CPB84DRAFT_1800512 [Gymnopilus junonius]|uniref:Uncharacterized protein n=1 Tax=Gymnopilus junonius TaxID=109634 RepID=A0A9P5NAE9_GYMJU|nr:hypothetical protein CPB84DRAFT_1800512 [Gymnopilus junonius]